MNRIRNAMKIAHIYKTLNFTYMQVDEVLEDIMKYSSLNKCLPIGYDKVTIKVKTRMGYIEMPFRFDWLERMVEFYGMTDAVNYSIMIVQKWFA